MTRNKPPSKKDAARGRIPAALRAHFPLNGDYKIASLDLGTGYTSVHIADVEVKSGKFTNLKSIRPTHFWQYPGASSHRPETTTEVPSVCAHRRGETDGSKALYGYQADDGGTSDETDALSVVDTMKVALYSGPEADKQKKILKDLALDVPYLVSRYRDTKLAESPETWILADYILWLVNLITIVTANERFGRDLFWVCTIPSNWDKTSHKMYADILDSANLENRYVLQSEVESAVAGLMHRSPVHSTLHDGEIFFVLDAGKGTSDFGVYRQTCTDPRQVEEIMPSRALFAGSRTVIDLWTMHVLRLCQDEAADDPDGFDAELATQRTIFVRRMHMYTGESGETVDRTYRMAGKKIEVTRDLMHSWFQMWMNLTESFLSQQFRNYRSRFQSPPAKMFLMGGSSNAQVLQTSVERLLREDAFFCDTELVPLGTEDSATVVAYGAIIRAVTRVMSSRKSHYWIGIARQDEYSKRSHINAPTEDVITDISPIGRYDKMQNRKFVKVIHWLAMPGDECIVDGSMEEIPSFMMAEYFDEEGSVDKPTDWTVPIRAYVCSSLDQGRVMESSEADILSGTAGKRGWSYESTIPDEDSVSFVLDLSPKTYTPLLVEMDLAPTNEFYDVSWVIYAETTGMGIEFWCGAYPDGKPTDATKYNEMLIQPVSRVLCADLVGVTQQSHSLGGDDSYVVAESHLESNGEDNPGAAKAGDYVDSLTSSPKQNAHTSSGSKSLSAMPGTDGGDEPHAAVGTPETARNKRAPSEEQGIFVKKIRQESYGAQWRLVVGAPHSTD